MPLAALRTHAFNRLLANRQALSRNPRVVLACSLALDAAISLADHWTGYEIRLAILHLIPIALATWALGRNAGLLISTFAAIAWVASFHESHGYTHVFYYYWESAVIIVSYVIFVLMLARLREALDHSDERFTTVLEGVDAAVYVEDPVGSRVLYANRRFLEMFGATHDRPPGIALPAGASGEVLLEASRRWYLVQARELRWIDGRAAVLRVLADITQEKTASELVSRHRDEVHRTSRLVALGEFASAIAHELSQPLAAITTYSNTSMRLLDSGRFEPAQLHDAMDKCRAQAKRAGDLIQRLREFLRHRSPALALVDLNAVAEAACRLAEPELREARVALSLELAAGLPQVRADSILIEQVVLNLVRNAIDAMQSVGSMERRITVASSTGAGNMAMVRVGDTGPGLQPEARDQLFEAFVSTKPDGLGLGLSICRSIVTAHGGSIRHEPGLDGGCVFEFSIPAVPR